MKRLGTFFLFALLSSTALAADPTASLGLGGRLMEKFADVLQNFEGVIRGAAIGLFGILMAIECSVWTYKQIINGIDDIGSFALKFSWNIMIFGFFGWLIMNSHSIMTSIIQSFFKIGQDATGLGSLDAVGMLSLGVKTALEIPKAADVGILSLLDKPLVALTAIIATLMIVIAFGVTAAQLIMAQVEAMIVISAAPIILAFGALSFTRDIAAKVLSHALGTGIKILTVYILAGVMTKIGPEMSHVLAENGAQFISSPGQLWEVISISFLMVLLAFFIPTIGNAMLSGQASLTGNAAITSTMGAAAGAAAIGAMAVGGARQAAGAIGSGITNSVAGATGLAQALKAGYEEAGDFGKTGPAAAAHAAGTVAGHGLGIATRGVGQAISSIGGSFSEKVANSTGANIASSINSSREGSISIGNPLPQRDLGWTMQNQGEGKGESVESVSSGASTVGSSANAPTGVAPSAITGNSSMADYPPNPAISGPGDDKPRTKLGKVAEAASNVLGSAHEMLNRGKDQVIDDRAQVGAAIDTRANY